MQLLLPRTTAARARASRAASSAPARGRSRAGWRRAAERTPSCRSGGRGASASARRRDGLVAAGLVERASGEDRRELRGAAAGAGAEAVFLRPSSSLTFGSCARAPSPRRSRTRPRLCFLARFCFCLGSFGCLAFLPPPSSFLYQGVLASTGSSSTGGGAKGARLAGTAGA